jgi:anti-sigma factor RsiW
MSVSAERLSCQELVELVTSYLDGALPELDRERFEHHISTCDGCGEYVEQMRATIRLTGSLRPADLTLEAERKLLAAFRGWRGSDGSATSS